MNNNVTVSIGISAFNEEQNIKKLLTSLLSQKEIGYSLKEIVVVSDGSNDLTVKLARNISDRRMRVEDDRRRLGKSARLNQLLAKLHSDIIVLLDADIKITNDELISRLIQDADIMRSGVVTVGAHPLPGRNFFEKCINHSVFLQNDIRSKWNNGNNYLSFRGCFIALSNDAAKKICLNESLYSNDAYIYFQVKKLGFIPKYFSSLNIFYRSPSTFQDHIKQSSRFQNSHQELSPFFPDGLMLEYKIPTSILLVSLTKSFLQNPLYLIGYMAIFLRAKTAKPQNLRSTWSIADSTKAV